jgi:hypothetical protein
MQNFRLEFKKRLNLFGYNVRRSKKDRLTSLMEHLESTMAKGKGGFKNIKLGKNVYRQLKRRGPAPPIPSKRQNPKPQQGNT